MGLKHPGAGLKVYDKVVRNLQARWDAEHPDSRATGGPNGPARVPRGKRADVSAWKMQRYPQSSIPVMTPHAVVPYGKVRTPQSNG